MERPNFLSEKYPDLPGSHSVERATAQANRDLERAFAAHTRDERITAYLDRLEHIVEDERGWELLKHKIVKDLTLDTSNPDTLMRVATGLYESEKRIAKEQGRGGDIRDLDGNPDLLSQYEKLVHEKHDIQSASLSTWLDYLQENDGAYPTWFRYYVIRSLGKMGQLDKEKGEYGKRGTSSVAPFPELNSEALGFVYRLLITGIGDREYTADEDKDKRATLATIIDKKDFARLYAFAQIETAGNLNRESLDGQWVLYPQGSDPHALEEALNGKGTGWCTATGSAPSQLTHGDFHVYYTRGTHGTYSEPRIAIRMDGGGVAEVRGVNHRQELEPALVDAAHARYHALPGGAKFDKKSEDMKQVTLLAQKEEKGIAFTKSDLTFLYELDSTIEGFGYDRDPRIEELRATRNPEEDMLVIFECTKEQVAHNAGEVTEHTKAYLGPWSPTIHQSIKNFPNITHLYESFPDKKIFRQELKTDPAINSPEKAEEALKAQNIYLSDYGKDILTKTPFSHEGKTYDLVQFTVAQLGFPQGATTKEMYDKARVLGLDLCPAEVGPHLRLSYPGKDLKFIAMEPISDRDGYPSVFYLHGIGAELALNANGGHAVSKWSSNDGFVFLSRKDS